MISNTIVRKNAYYDSVTLMSLSSKILELDGIEEAVISMGTEMNKELLENVELSNEETRGASNNDLIIAIKAINNEVYEEALKIIDESLNSKKKGKEKKDRNPKTIVSALKEMNDGNLAVISVPGQYAAREAKIALENGLNVMLFSDNVDLKDEKALKELAKDKGLLVMGPDCGTASINNTGLCFANKVEKGNIGLVAASGTGLQEVMVQIDRLGGGISQAIGTGGRDLKEEIGGIMMLEGLKALDRDENTDVIVLISKPPAKKVEKKILEQVKNIKKQVVICFIEGDSEKVEKSNAIFADNLYNAAKKAVEASGLEIKLELRKNDNNEINRKITEAKSKLNDNQKYLRGLFGGGTLCAEALYILRDKLTGIQSNVAKREEEKLKDINNYNGNVLLDLGEDEFTVGKPHPMIEPTLRLDKIKETAKDESVGVVLMDFELGYGSHEDPVGVTISTIEEAQQIAKKDGRNIIFVVYVCGTSKDKQDYKKQIQMLENGDIIIAESNVEAANIVANILS
ncbi:acyl-CoA synthetase FdrA [Sporosalibacterium faouarense]|uniref:acyl-CoA synthetase FdrA n=1 Tax=Sporosalibacterium faouarense TaxID=516123 RepID=UPI00192AD8A1|nr:acyl-CoA synthetase FdrA [Sporosalibacterium faouarense]